MDDVTRRPGLQPLSADEAWRALMHRVMPAYPARVTPAEPEVEILPGGVPASLPFDVPFPPGSRAVGTILNGGGTEKITIYLDALESAAEILAFYHEHLSLAGWYELDRGGRRSRGFNDVDPSRDADAQFCRGERGPALFVRAVRHEGEPTSVHLGLYTDERTGPCVPRERRGSPDSPIPALPPPAGARFVMGAGPGGSVGPNSAHSGTEIEAEIDLDALAAHYKLHLEAGGWIEEESGQDGRCAWSTWKFRHEREENWRGLFVAFQRPDVPRRYILQAHAEWLPAD